MLEFSRAVSALRVSEQNLFVTSNNLSNVNTEGYRRQQLVQREFQPVDMGSYTIGLGVDSNTVRQLKSEFLERNYRNELGSYGQYTVEDKIYGDLQTLIGDPTVEVMQGAISRVWEAANEISKDITGTIARSYLREGMASFLRESNNIEEQLIKMQNELDGDIKEAIRKINNYAESIADLNEDITKYEAGGTRANSLRDSRDLAIEELSKLVGVEIEETSDTMVNIRCGNGFLVVNANANPLTTVENTSESVFCCPVWESTGKKLEVTTGELKGLLNMRGESVTGNLIHSSNGSPKEKADIIINIDPNLSAEKIESMKENIGAMIDKMELYDTNYQFYLNDGTAVTKQELLDYVDGLTAGAGAFDVLADSATYKNYTYRDDSSKYVMIFTESPLTATATQTKAADRELNLIGMRTIVVTDQDDTVKTSWKRFAEGTSGNIYDIEDLATEDGMGNMGLALSRDINSRLDETANDDGIPNVRAGLNSFVNVLAKEFNAIFRQGMNKYGERNGSVDPNTGETICLDFFVKVDDDLPFQMGNIELNPLFSDLEKMPLSQSGASGDLSIGEMMVDLREANVFSNGDEYSSFEDFYANYILNLGTAASEVSTGLTTQETLVSEANEKRLAVSSVSMDEELSKMLKFQYSYTSASKMINVINEMLDTIINKL